MVRPHKDFEKNALAVVTDSMMAMPMVSSSIEMPVVYRCLLNFDNIDLELRLMSCELGMSFLPEIRHNLI